jgi:phosphatidylserine decarboxylase
MQYSPLDGVVHSTEYDRTGKFHLAYDLGKSRFNEKRIHQIDTTWGPVTIMQIAGFLTRRIDSWIEPGQYLNASQPLGFIHLGSRVDLILPANGLTLEIKKGDKLQGGKKRIGYYEFKSLPNSL